MASKAKARKAFRPKRKAKKAKPVEVPAAGPGRPLSYDPERHPAQAYTAYKAGLTDREVADLLGIGFRTLYDWWSKFPEFLQMSTQGSEEHTKMQTERVKRSLFHRAVGYTYEAEKVFQHQGEIIRAPVVEHVPPSEKAAIFWLLNRDPENWKDKVEVENKGGIVVELVDPTKPREGNDPVALPPGTLPDGCTCNTVTRMREQHKSDCPYKLAGKGAPEDEDDSDDV